MSIVAERFATASRRILWLLREPNGSGGWDLRAFLATDEALFKYKRWWATFGLVASVSHGLLHELLPWGAWATNPKTLTAALRQIAVINVNKRGGIARVNWNRLKQASIDFGPMLVRQIQLLAPQVVILGGSFQVLPDQLREPLGELAKVVMSAVRVGDCVWFRGYHPNQTRVSRQAYYEKLRGEVLRLQGRAEHS